MQAMKKHRSAIKKVGCNAQLKNNNNKMITH